MFINRYAFFQLYIKNIILFNAIIICGFDSDEFLEMEFGSGSAKDKTISYYNLQSARFSWMPLCAEIHGCVD